MALTAAVKKMHSIHFEGNIIPHSWYTRITYKKKRVLKKKTGTTIEEITVPHLAAIILLAEFCYWFRPVEVVDRRTGKHLGWRQRFSGEMLRRSYSELGEKFGISKKQAKDAVDLLVKM